MKLSPILERYRLAISGQHWSPPKAEFGAFQVPGPRKTDLRIIAHNGRDNSGEGVEAHLLGWEHVSVSTETRVPMWDEMTFVKGLFWDDEECVIQYHPPRSRYVNNHPHVLHLWRPIDGMIPMPPSLLVGYINETPETVREKIAAAQQEISDSSAMERG